MPRKSWASTKASVLESRGARSCRGVQRSDRVAGTRLALLPGGGVGALALGGLLLLRQWVSHKRVIERSSALFFLTSATNLVALVGAGALLAVGVVSGPHDLVLTGTPIAGGLLVVAAVLLIPVLTVVQRAAAVRGGSLIWRAGSMAHVARWSLGTGG